MYNHPSEETRLVGITPKIIQGHVLDVLKRLPANSIQCVVTSPPYHGLRKYGTTPQTWDDNLRCEHVWGALLPKTNNRHSNEGRWEYGSMAEAVEYRATDSGAFCCKCSAWRGELGSEPTPDMFVQHLVEVFREVRRILRLDGLVWLNIGDSYASHVGGHHADLREKNLELVPFRLALALQADGWIMRSDIVWSKLHHCMPESTRSRPTRAHEFIFMMAKEPQYYYDKYAFLQPPPSAIVSEVIDVMPMNNGTNLRDVWELKPEGYSGSHFATFPSELPHRSILLSTPENGECSVCGKLWRRIVSNERGFTNGRCNGCGRSEGQHISIGNKSMLGAHPEIRKNRATTTANENGAVPCAAYRTVRWTPSCECKAPALPSVVLDPFCGSGTTLQVARKLGRRSIGIELNPEYVQMAELRSGALENDLQAEW